MEVRSDGVIIFGVLFYEYLFLNTKNTIFFLNSCDSIFNNSKIVSKIEIVDGNVKMTLGLIWTIILRFAIQDISVEGEINFSSNNVNSFNFKVYNLSIVSVFLKF